MLVGSYALPSWYQTALEHIGRGEYGDLDVRETVSDAVRLAVADQLTAGVDVLTDGEMRRSGFIMGFYGRLQGLATLPAARRIGLPFYDSETMFDAVEHVQAPGGLGLIEEWHMVKPLGGSLPVKIACAGALSLTNPITKLSGYQTREALVADLVQIVNDELRALSSAGVPFLQIDESTHVFESLPTEKLAETFNASVAGIDRSRTTLGLHLCFGNLVGRPHSRRSYADLLPHLARMDVDVVFLEFANREWAELDLWRKYGEGKTLAAGVIDVKSFHRETPDDVAASARKVLQVVSPDRLCLTADCGFFATPRWIAQRKLSALGEGARRMRKELGYA